MAFICRQANEQGKRKEHYSEAEYSAEHVRAQVHYEFSFFFPRDSSESSPRFVDTLFLSEESSHRLLAHEIERKKDMGRSIPSTTDSIYVLESLLM